MNSKLKHSLLQPLALGLLLLGAGAASAATDTGSTAGDMDSRDYTLAVASARGTPGPAVGTSTTAWQSAVTCSVDSAVSEGSTNYTCTGWAGTGAIPATGATNNTGAIVLTNVVSSLAWQWQVQSYTCTVTLHPGAHGSIAGANSGTDYVVTVTNGTAFLAATVTANEGWTFTGWSPELPATVTANFETTAQYVVVVKADPSVTAWPTATAITYGQTLLSSTLSGGVASVGGTFAFTTPRTAPAAATTAQGVTFMPTNTANYSTVSGSVSVTVNKATPIVTTWPTATAITYGQTLAASSLSGGVASVGGSFAFTTPTTAPAAGTTAQGVTFTPTNTANYSTVSGSVSVTVNPLPAVLTGSRLYDGTVDAAAAILTVSNALAGDTVTVVSGKATLAGALPGVRAITSMGTLVLGGVPAAPITP